MPRPKGSKNKAKTPVVIIDYAAELEKKISEKNTLEADITALEADVDGLKVQLKEKKTALKALDKEIAALEQKKSRQDTEALRKAQKEEIDKAIQQLLDDGMSMEEVLNINGCFDGSQRNNLALSNRSSWKCQFLPFL